MVQKGPEFLVQEDHCGFIASLGCKIGSLPSDLRFPVPVVPVYSIGASHDLVAIFIQHLKYPYILLHQNHANVNKAEYVS